MSMQLHSQSSSDASQPPTNEGRRVYSYLATNSSQTNPEANAWLLPDGVGDLMADDARNQEQLRYQLTGHLMRHGYQLICPPMIEYTESLLGAADEHLKRQTFKLIDQLTGRLMAVRADITPQIARIDAQQQQAYNRAANSVARYCYAGHVIHTLPQGLFSSRTPLQLGAEIFGCADLTADIELITLVFSMLNQLQLTQAIHIDFGHAGIFERLTQLAGLTAEQISQLQILYERKSLPELMALCETLPLGEDFLQLAQAGHSIKELQAALSATVRQDDIIHKGLTDIKELQAFIKSQWQQVSVSIDITELRGYHYHTGIIFSVYIGEITLPVIKGGRFDGIGQGYHPDSQQHTTDCRPATGFSCDITRLLSILPQPSDTCILAPDYHQVQHDTQLRNYITALRDAGKQVIVPLNDQDQPVATHRIVADSKAASGWVVQPLTTS